MVGPWGYVRSVVYCTWSIFPQYLIGMAKKVKFYILGLTDRPPVNVTHSRLIMQWKLEKGTLPKSSNRQTRQKASHTDNWRRCRSGFGSGGYICYDRCFVDDRGRDGSEFGHVFTGTLALLLFLLFLSNGAHHLNSWESAKKISNLKFKQKKKTKLGYMANRCD